MKPKSSLRSGTLAGVVGVSTDTLRLYERKGLLHSPSRSANGYRCYPPESVARVRLIRAALSLGFSIDELGKVLKIRDAGGVPCHRVREMAAAKMQALDQNIEQLVRLRDELRETLEMWAYMLEQAPPQERAGLLEALAARPEKARTLPPHLYATVTRETRR